MEGFRFDWVEKVSGVFVVDKNRMNQKMEMQEQILVERELNQLMEETLRLEAELTLVLISGRN